MAFVMESARLRLKLYRNVCFSFTRGGYLSVTMASGSLDRNSRGKGAFLSIGPIARFEQFGPLGLFL